MKTRLPFLLCSLIFATILIGAFFKLVIITAGAGSSGLPRVFPAPNSQHVPVTATILISFTASINPSSVSSRTISVYGMQQGIVDSAYAVTNTQVLITPVHPMFPGDLIQVVVTTGTHAISGTALAEPLVWQFRTRVGASTGILVQRPWSPDSTWSEDIAIGDLNGDGHPDVFLANRDLSSSVWFNDGTAHFTTNGFNYGNDFVISIALGDVEGDGDLDAFFTAIQNQRLYINDGHGTFTPGPVPFKNQGDIARVALGDLNGDGKLDAVTASFCDPFDPDQNCTYAVNMVWLNQGSGQFKPSGQILGHGTTRDIALGDLNTDGKLDAIVLTHAGAFVWENMGSGIFSATQRLDSLSDTSVQLGDLNNDGRLDAFITSITDSQVWLNNGAGHLTPGQWLGNLSPAKLGDLNGDGSLDAITTDASVWLNQGAGTFVYAGYKLTTDTISGLALGDLNSDGLLDAVASTYAVKPILWTDLQKPFWIYIPFLTR